MCPTLKELFSFIIIYFIKAFSNSLLQNQMQHLTKQTYGCIFLYGVSLGILQDQFQQFRECLAFVHVCQLQYKFIPRKSLFRLTKRQIHANFTLHLHFLYVGFLSKLKIKGRCTVVKQHLPSQNLGHYQIISQPSHRKRKS